MFPQNPVNESIYQFFYHFYYPFLFFPVILSNVRAVENVVRRWSIIFSRRDNRVKHSPPLLHHCYTPRTTPCIKNWSRQCYNCYGGHRESQQGWRVSTTPKKKKKNRVHSVTPVTKNGPWRHELIHQDPWQPTNRGD